VVREYLQAFVGRGVGAVVLGCTHYPLFRPLIEEQVRTMLGPHVNVVDSALATADEARAFLVDRELTTTRTRPGELEFLVTDRPRSFEAVAQRFLGDSAPSATVIDLGSTALRKPLSSAALQRGPNWRVPLGKHRGNVCTSSLRHRRARM
jgi:glutamate racemase